MNATGVSTPIVMGDPLAAVDNLTVLIYR